MIDALLRYSTPDETDTDCPECKSKNSLSRFENSRFLVSKDDKLMYTACVLWYGCRMCAHRYVDKAFQAEYDKTVQELSIRIKDDVISNRKSKYTTLKVIICLSVLAIIGMGYWYLK